MDLVDAGEVAITRGEYRGSGREAFSCQPRSTISICLFDQDQLT